jgi:putative ABC transport system permease protein
VPEPERPEWPKDRATRAARTILRLGARLVPFHRRRRWLAEWEGELWMMHRRGKGRIALLRFAASGVGHGIWERREEGDSMGSALINDVRLAARRLARTPGFTLVTIAILGLGIGANTALFSALEAALLRTPAYPDPERIVLVDLLLESRAGEPADTMGWSYPKFELGRSEIASVAPVAGYSLSTVTLSGNGPPTRLNVEYVTPAYFDVLGARPELGRLFTPEEEAPAAAPVVVLSHALWRDRYGADPGVLERPIVLNGATLRVVGVMQEGVRGVTGGADLWVPVAGIATISGPRRLQLAWAHWLTAVGRLAPDASLERARDEAVAVGRTLTQAYPDPDGGGAHGVAVTPFLSARVNPIARTAVATVSLAALVFLLIACGNVAGLLIARASARRGDTAVRNALGAGRWRIAAEHLTESLLLGLAGGALGLGLAVAGQTAVAGAVRYALETSGARNLQYLDPEAIGVGWGTLATGVGAALLTSVVFGLLPALQASAISPGDELRRSGGATLGRRRTGAADAVRSGMVALQLVLTLVLLTGAGLMGASLGRLAELDVGFTHDRVLTLAYDRGPGATDEEHRAFMADALARLEALPGIEAASAATCPPLAGRCEIAGLRQIDDGPAADYSEMGGVLAYVVTDGYFDAIGVPLLEGRGFEASDRDGAPVVLVNRAAAREHFGDVSPVGHRISITHSLTESEMATIVGVVGDVRYGDLEEPPMPAVYLSERQVAMPFGTLVVRTEGEPYAVLGAVRSSIGELDPDLPLFGVSTLEERHFAATARTRIILGLLASFALAGLFLSAIGLYGLVSNGVVARTREVGLRIALGADRRSVFRMLTARPAALVATSLVVGVGVAWWSSRWLGTLLFETSPDTPTPLAAAVLVLTLVTAAATWLPAHKATRLPPSTTLRAE